MNTQIKLQHPIHQAVTPSVQEQRHDKPVFQFNDNRHEAILQKKQQEFARNYTANRQYPIQMVATRSRANLSKGDLSRKAQHTAGAMKHGSKRWSFQSGQKGGFHAEDVAVNVLKDHVNSLPKGNGTQRKVFTIYITKSPCYSGDKEHSATFTPKAGAKKKQSCTNTLIKTHNMLINGYIIKLNLRIWRIYHGIGIKGAQESSQTAIMRIREGGIPVSGIDSDDDILSDYSDDDSAKEWRKKQRGLINKRRIARIARKAGKKVVKKKGKKGGKKVAKK